MKNTSIAFIAGLFVTLILGTSCGTKYPKEMAAIDTLQTEVNKAVTELKTIDSVKVERVYTEIKDDITFIQKNYTDTLTLEMAEFLGEYNSLLKAIGSILKEYTELSNELSFTGGQLKNMKHDLEYNIVNEEKVKEYYAREEEAIKRNVESTIVMINAAKLKLEMFEKMNPQIKKLIESVKNKN
jgi:predicted  nucleic acid-binding Zn-ribbon protein